MVEAEIIRGSKRELIDSIPKVLVYGGTLILIWLFSKLVFIPLGDGVLWGDIRTSHIIVTITVIVALMLVLKILKEIRDMCDAIAGFVAYSIDKKSTMEELGDYRKAVRNLGYVIVVVLLYMYFGSILGEIHPALSGIILIIVFSWAVGALYGIGMTVSDKIEKKAKRFTGKILHEGEGEKSITKEGETKSKK